MGNISKKKIIGIIIAGFAAITTALGFFFREKGRKHWTECNRR